VPKFVPFKVKIAFSAETVDNQTTTRIRCANCSCSGKRIAYRIILCRAKPREIIGVIGLMSDMFVSVFPSKPVFL
jgi:hypothetical protein